MPFYRMKTHTEPILDSAECKTTLSLIEDDKTLPEKTYGSILMLLVDHDQTERLAMLACLIGDEIAYPYAGFGPYHDSLPCEGSDKSFEMVNNMIRKAAFRHKFKPSAKE
jgi:hypothetical protein